MSKPDKIVSPCTQICTIGADGDLCIGCGRTLEEIGRWSNAATDDRLAILRELEAGGVLAVRRSVPVVATALKVSRSSVYALLAEIRRKAE